MLVQKIVPEAQCGMLTPPFMDHWMTLEPISGPKQGMGSNTVLQQRTWADDSRP
jgi:hypothetical protein